MNAQEIKGNWKQLKGKVREKWGELTDDDLQRVDGRKDQLAGKLQERYGETLDAWNKRVDEFFSGQKK